MPQVTRSMKDHEELDSRIVRVEAQIEALGKSVKDLADVVKTMTRTNWGVIFSGIATLLAVGVLYVSPFIKDLEAFRRDLTNQESLFLGHIRDGHPSRIEQRIKALEGQFKALERTRLPWNCHVFF